VARMIPGWLVARMMPGWLVARMMPGWLVARMMTGWPIYDGAEISRLLKHVQCLKSVGARSSKDKARDGMLVGDPSDA
jgi:hypothetical protein